jgi:hypothetical protein
MTELGKTAASDEPEPEKCPNCGEEGHDEYNCDERETCFLCGSEGHDEEECPEKNKIVPGYSDAMTLKFVHDPSDDEFVVGNDPQTYYDRPHHSDYMEELAEKNDNWDFGNHNSGYYYLENATGDALTVADGVSSDTIVSGAAPHQGIIDEFRSRGYNPHTWRHYTGFSGHTDHPIPPATPKPEAKIAVVPPFHLIKFVSLNDRFLIGEDTHHAFLLSTEYGTNTFPADTGAIGRAWVENNTITGVGFDYGDVHAQTLAIKRLKEWARDEGYNVDPDLDVPIVGLSAVAPTAFAYVDGHLYYGVDHQQIMDDNNTWENLGVYGRILDRYDGSQIAEIYSDYYEPNQEKEKIEEAMAILQKRFPSLMGYTTTRAFPVDVLDDEF